MVKKIMAGALIIGVLLLPGCGNSNYQTYSNNLAKQSVAHDMTKKESMKYGFQALEKIMGFYEEQLKASSKESKEKSLFKYTAYDSKSNVIGTYELADVTSGYVSIINNMTIATSRERVVREFAPIFENISKDLIAAGTPPKSWIDVANEFVKHVPLMASMGAMYGLSTLALDKAGTNISATLKDNAQLNNINGSGNNLATNGATASSTVIKTDTKITNQNSNNGNTTTETTEAAQPVETQPIE